MTHPDPRAAEIQARNAQAIADATGAPPPDIADNPAAYLEWARRDPSLRPTAPHKPYPALVPAPTTKGRHKPARRRPAPTMRPPADLEAERRRQLDALEALGDQT